MMIRTRGLSRINLNVSDIERSARFYQEVFGGYIIELYAQRVLLNRRGRVGANVVRLPACA